MQVHVEKVSLKQLLIEVQRAVSYLADEKHLALNIDCADQLQLETDRKRLYQVVLNVVSNGLKYTEYGSVNVSTKVQSDVLLIQVTDRKSTRLNSSHG